MAGAEYILGDKRLTIESLGIEVEYKVMVACPATKSLSSATEEHKAHLCPDLLGRNKYDPEKLWELPWREEDKNRIKTTDFFEMQVVAEWPYCPWPANIVQAIHLGAREDLPEMYILSKVTMFAYLTMVGGMKVTTPHTFNGYKVDIDHHNEWPDHAISYNGLVYINEGLKAAHYAAAGCPIYKKPADKHWSFNRAEISAKYIENERWRITSNWLGIPEGEGALGLKHTTPEGEYITVSYPVSSAYLRFTGPAVVHMKMEADPKCMIQYCKESSVISSQTIDVVTKHATTSRTVLAYSSQKPNAPCQLTTSDGAEHYVIAGKPTQINTRASKISAGNVVNCPEPVDGFDDTYGSLMDKLTAKGRDNNPLNILDAILPDIGNLVGKIKKILPIGIAAGVVYVLGMNQASLIAGIAVYIALAGIPGALAYTDKEIVTNTYDPVMVLLYIILEKKVVITVSLIIFIMNIKYQDVDERIYKVLMYIVAFSEGPRSVRVALVGFLLAMMSFWARTFFSTHIKEFEKVIDQYYVRATYMMNSVAVALGEQGYKQHSTSCTYTKVPKAKTYVEEPTQVLISSRGRRVYTNTLPNWRKCNAIEGHARRNIRNMRGWVLYEEEYDKLRHTLLNMTDREIEKIYDFCPRVHGRQAWDLYEFIDEVPIRLRGEVRQIWLLHGSENPL